ncbi:hypothetical protein MIU24_19490 [Streptomyces venezuelae]|uniref:hypothetical protein n=1 Tax=Streptomyces sp. B6(2022) TaxID=3404749 RepID=UPI00311D2D69
MGPREDRGDASIPDDVWEQFLKDSVAGVPDAPEEPSARAREVTERLLNAPADEDGWRTYTPAPARRRGRGWYLVGLLAAAALLVAAFDPWDVIGSSGDGASGTPLAQESERPTGAPPVEPARLATLAEPFRGSPAARWADGAAGISVPPARATGWMSTAQVEKALRQTRDFLVASSLDPAVLRGERPTRAIALVNPHQKDVKDYLAAAFAAAPTQENDPLLLFSRFEPSHARLVGDVVKTRGRITFREGERGALQVATDVTYVYPVVSAAPGSDEVVRTIARREVVVNWSDPSKVVTAPGTLSLVSYKVDMTNGGCDDRAGWFAPEFGTRGPAEEGAGGETVDPYDRSTPVSGDAPGSPDQGCRTASRS